MLPLASETLLRLRAPRFRMESRCAIRARSRSYTLASLPIVHTASFPVAHWLPPSRTRGPPYGSFLMRRPFRSRIIPCCSRVCPLWC